MTFLHASKKRHIFVKISFTKKSRCARQKSDKSDVFDGYNLISSRAFAPSSSPAAPSFFLSSIVFYSLRLLTRDLFERIAVKNYYLSAAGLYYAKVTQLIDLAADDDTCRAEAVCYLL